MNNRENDLIMPALIAGALAGVISSIPFFHCLCCLWILAAGVLASYLAITRYSPHPESIKSGDALLAGVLAGIFAAIISLIIKTIWHEFYLNWTERFLAAISRFAEDSTADWESWLETARGRQTPLNLLLDLLLTSIIYAVLGAIGGLMGFSLFKPATGAKNETTIVQNPGNSQPGL
ncbi:MAG: hypothetical protein WBI18_04560 [Candidatus Saccharicenans sp.]